MLTLNKNTKKAKGFLRDREWAKNKGNFSIHSVYAKPSTIKLVIAKEIEQRLNSVVYHNGNSFYFTCSGIDRQGNLIIETKSNTYKIVL